MTKTTIRNIALLAALTAAAGCGGRGDDGADAFERLTERMGGTARLGRLRSLAFEADLVLEIRGTQTAARVDQEIVFPDAVRTETTIDGETTVTATDGTRAWTRGAEGVVEADPAEARRMVDDARRVIAYAVSRAGEPGFSVSAAGAAEVEGEACDEIRIAAADVTTTVCVAADGRPLRQSYDEDLPLLGGRGSVDVVLADHRKIDGVLFAFREKVLFDGRPFARATYRYVRIDPTLDPSRFRPD